jgi:Ala-tRNA(Pro) deacylase
MPATPDDLFRFLDRLGIAHPTVTHPPLFTVEQSQALRGQIAGGHSKNLFLKAKGERSDAVLRTAIGERSDAVLRTAMRGDLYLVSALEDAAIALKSLHRRLGAGGRFSFGSADLMRQTLGVEPGAVTPFGALNDTEGRVTVVLDAAMMAQETLNFHPLVNTMTTSIGRHDLMRFLAETGHQARIEPVSGEGAGG